MRRTVSDDPAFRVGLLDEDLEPYHHWSYSDADESDYFPEDDMLYSEDGPLYEVRDYYQADYGIATRTHPPPFERIIFSIHFTVESLSSSPGGHDPRGTFEATAIQLTARVLTSSSGQAVVPVLSSLGVPADLHRRILDQICETASTMLADPEHAMRLIFTINVSVLEGELTVAPVVNPYEQEFGRSGTREEEEGEESYSYGTPATESSIRTLKRVSACDLQQHEEGRNRCCSICMEEFELAGESDLSEMPCSHVFHGDCIERWLRMSHTCPLCRYQMPRALNRSMR